MFMHLHTNHPTIKNDYGAEYEILMRTSAQTQTQTQRQKKLTQNKVYVYSSFIFTACSMYMNINPK